MKQFLLAFAALTLMNTQTVTAQFKKKDMKLDSAFHAKADRMEVKMGWQVTGKLWGYKFGEYHLTENKLQGGNQTETSNFWGTKSTVSSKSKFHFQLSDDQQHSVKVDGSIQNKLTTLHELQISQHLYIGESGLANSKRNFLATLVSGDDTASWKMVLIERTDSPWVALLTNGIRTIDIIRIFEFEDGKAPEMGMSAGCVLRENNEIIGAVQYYGNRYNNNVIWLLKLMEPKEKCFIAAALTALMASAHNGQEAMENAMNSQ
jgi:hypothetical protein